MSVKSWTLPAVLFLALCIFCPNPAIARERDGAQLYQQNCSRCHSERFATEKTDAQWQTVMLHMRIRGQIPSKDADAILDYLQQSN